MSDELTLADEQPEVNPQVLGEVEEDVEPIGAQILRRLHKDHSILMRDYDEMLRHLEHPEVRAHLTEHLKGKDKFLSGTEKLFKRHYKELPPLEDQDEDDANGEELVEQEDDVVDNLEPQHKDLTQDEIDEFQRTLNEQAADTEENPVVDDEDTTNAVAADSDQEQYPTPEEALEGMEADRKSMRGYRVKNTPQQQQQKKKPGLIRKVATGAALAGIAGGAAYLGRKPLAVAGRAALAAGKPVIDKVVESAGPAVRTVAGAAAPLVEKVAKPAGTVVDAGVRAGQQVLADAGVSKPPPGKVRGFFNRLGRTLTGQRTVGERVGDAISGVAGKLKQTGKKKSLEDDRICQECMDQGKTECNCMGNKAMDDEQYQDESPSFYDENAEDIDETRNYLRELSEAQDYGDEQRQKSFHYHKVMRKLGDKLAKTATALGSKAFAADGEKGVIGSTLRTAGKLAALGGAGYLAYKNPGAVAAIGRAAGSGISRAATAGGEAFMRHAPKAVEATGRAVSNLGRKVEGAVPKVAALAGRGTRAAGNLIRSAGGATSNLGARGVAAQQQLDAKLAAKQAGKALPEDDERLMQEEENFQDEDQFESQDEYQGPSDEELQKAYDSVAKVADFFNDLSKTRDFGDKHRASADLFRKEMDILIDGDNDDEEKEDDQEEDREYDEAGFEPGETGRKALELKKALEKRDAAIDELQRKLNCLNSVICN